MNAQTAITIGTPVRDPYGSTGYVSDVLPGSPGCFVIGQGMAPVRAEYEVAFPNRVSVLADGILAPMVARAAHIEPKPVHEVEAIKAEALKAQAAARDAAQQARIEADARGSAFRIEAAKRCPDWAESVIVAELHRDDCDSMTDYFNHQTDRVVILGFSRHARDLFPELRKFAAGFPETAHLATASEKAEHREKYSMGAGYYLKEGFRDSNGWAIKKVRLYARPGPHGVTYPKSDSIPVGEWAPTPVEEKAPAAVTAAPVSAGGLTISEHTHTKKQFQFWIVELADRVDRAEYDRLLSDAKGRGGWYSRAWAGTPAGFAFKREADALEFMAANGAGATETPAASTSAPAAPRAAAASNGATVAEKLRGMADALEPKIESQFADRLSNTPKRQRQAQGARLEGYRLQRTQAGLRALADCHEAGTVPAELAHVKTKAAAYELARAQIENHGGYYDAGTETGKPGDNTPAALAFWALVAGAGEARKEADELKRKIEALQFARIPGYFPTPPAVIAQMLDYARIPAGGCVVLEPSAGSGAILDAVKAEEPGCSFCVYECNFTLGQILEAKGYHLTGSDFMEADALRLVDRVLMNPPFENGQDMAHVRHAFDCLKDGGRLVSIMSPGPFFRQDSKAQAFRAWFDALGGEKYDIPAGAFKESGTGVASVLVILDR